jgi:hypothetical protein
MVCTTNRCLVGAVLAIGVMSVTTGLCQSIRIPDFRETPSVRATPVDGPCDDCGVIRSIREVHKGQNSPLYRTSAPSNTMSSDPVIGAVVVVIPIGPGSSESKPFVGGVGTPEMQQQLGELSYEIVVRMNDGTLRTFERRDGRQYNIGDRVKVGAGKWELIVDGKP